MNPEFPIAAVAAAATAGARPAPTVHIEASRRWVPINFHELWTFRHVLYFLVWRDVKVRYKQTALGAAWAILQPVLTMLVFSLFFGRLAKMPSDHIPYPLFAYTALVPWMLFSTGLTFGANSMVSNGNLIKKVYFPRLSVPVGAVLACLVDFVLAFVVLLGMMLRYRVAPSPRSAWMFAFLLLTVVTSLGASLWLSALNVRFRDVKYVTPFLVQFWMFATPIAYSSSLLHGRWHTLYGLNPMAGVVDGFRWALLGASVSPGPMIAVSSVVAIIMLICGAFYFRSVEKSFADLM